KARRAKTAEAEAKAAAETAKQAEAEAKKGAAGARAVEKKAAERQAKAAALAEKERNLALGELRRYKIQHAEETLIYKEKVELNALIRDLEAKKLTPTAAEAKYQELLARA